MAALAVAAVVLAGCTVGGSTDEASPTQPPAETTPGGTAPGETTPGETTPAETMPGGTPTAPAGPSCDDPCRDAAKTVGRFAKNVAPEASGLAASRRNPGLLYIVDDGPGTAHVVVVRARNAKLVGTLAIDGLDSTDTEDLAVGPCAPDDRASCIYVGDIGDNVRARDAITIVRAREPDLSHGTPAGALTSESVALSYPDRPHDAEALLIGSDATIGVVTKAAGKDGAGAARLYTAPTFADGTLKRAGRVRVPLPSMPFATTVVGNVITGADAYDGRVVLRTYDAVFEYVAPGRASPLADFPGWDVTEIPVLAEPQGEAVAYGADGCSIFTVSENSNRLNVVPCRT